MSRFHQLSGGKIGNGLGNAPPLVEVIAPCDAEPASSNPRIKPANLEMEGTRFFIGDNSMEVPPVRLRPHGAREDATVFMFDSSYSVHSGRNSPARTDYANDFPTRSARKTR